MESLTMAYSRKSKMTETNERPGKGGVQNRLDPENDRVVTLPNAAAPRRRRRSGGMLFGAAALLLLVGSLGFGAWRHYQGGLAVAATTQQIETAVPAVHVAAVRASDSKITVSLPATTTAFEAANIFARTNGYIEKRYVDIGDRVKAGDLLADIVAPELDHQIAQAQATLAQNQATLQQTQASRDLAQVTNARDSNLVKQGWLTLQQGDNDRLTLQAQQAAVGVAQSNIAAQQAQIRVLQQEKAYQRVVAPFDGVITQRNIDNGSLVTSGSTFMFTLMHPDVIRTQVFIPQDEAFGVGPGVEAVVRVPEIPNRSFPGTVTRIASALQPGSRTLLTEIDVPNPDGALSPGIYCTVELYIPRKTPSMIIPADAVIFNETGLHVAVVENGTARLQKIDIARDFGKEVEVHDGVKPGDQVILNPMVDLADGAKVTVRKVRKTQTS
jgi:RND family efflux transporter MFP subunit